MKSLTAACIQGLANRLQVLTSGLALAEHTGRRFEMLWPRTPHCPADFADLFSNDWPVQSIKMEDIPARSSVYRRRRLHTDETNLVVQDATWLFSPRETEQNIAIFERTKDFIRQLQPTSEIQHEIDAFRSAHFHKRMIGVHLRRGDFLHVHPHSSRNTSDAIEAVDLMLKTEPESGILLCSDEPPQTHAETQPVQVAGVRDLFRQRYGSRIVWHTAASLDRTNPLAIRDAVIDLWLLRNTDCFVGTMHSSFSEFAIVDRDVPSLIVDGHSQHYYRIVSLLRSTGLLSALHTLSRCRHGRRMTTAEVIKQLRSSLRR